MLTSSTVDPTGGAGALAAAATAEPEQRHWSLLPVDRRRGSGVLAIAPGLLAAVLLIALNVPRLGRRPLWLDEAYTVGATGDLVATWRGTGGTMGLYYLVMWPVTQISTDREWVRLPSLLFAAATVVVVHAIGRRLGGGRMGAVAATMLSLMWAFSRYAVEARSYALAMLLVSLSWLGLVGALQASAEAEADAQAAARATRIRRRWWWVWAVATLLAPLAHGLTALQFVVQVLLLGTLRGRWRWWWACVPVAIGLAAEGAMLFGIGAGEVASWIAPLNRGQIAAILRVMLGHGVLAWLVGALAILGGVLAVREGSRRGGDTDDRLALVPLVWAVGLPLLVIVISLFRPYAVARYMLSSLPGVALLVAAVVSRLRPVTLAAVAAVLAVLLLVDQPETNSRYPEDWPALVRQIVADGADGDRLAVRHVLRGPLDYAWDEVDAGDRLDLVPLSPTDPIGEVRRFYDPPDSSIQALLVADPSAPVWYIERDHLRLHAVVALLSDPAIESRYEVTGRWTFPGELYLIRLEPRDPWRTIGLAVGRRLGPFAAPSTVLR